jgi:hypothetical protein
MERDTICPSENVPTFNRVEIDAYRFTLLALRLSYIKIEADSIGDGEEDPIIENIGVLADTRSQTWRHPLDEVVTDCTGPLHGISLNRAP